MEDGEGWMEMIKSRIQSSHTYNEEVAEEIIDKIIHQYNDLFSDLYIKMEPLIRLSDEKIWLETRTY
ncbi:nucleotidyltransferase substrate binding protein [Dyadobacter subterraneus]|uniref:nucleotidyltransferase substrate binding protein n=2 Tax=Dyadobacter subterraneus TaxID=2773304 RepID=UPI00286D6E3A|nr:nucleotidyltransferase substrate binding protein [Dyadobacter subterraneus]